MAAARAQGPVPDASGLSPDPRGASALNRPLASGVDSTVSAGHPESAAGRLSLKQCRVHLPAGFEINDEHLQRVCDELYQLAEVMLDEGSDLHARLHG